MGDDRVVEAWPRRDESGDRPPLASNVRPADYERIPDGLLDPACVGGGIGVSVLPSSFEPPPGHWYIVSVLATIQKKLKDWIKRPTGRSLICFLAGLPLAVLFIWIADPLLEPIRQSRVLRKVVFCAIMVWIMVASGLGTGIAIKKQAGEISRSPALQAGPVSGFLMFINGIMFVLAIISMILFLLAG